MSVEPATRSFRTVAFDLLLLAILCAFVAVAHGADARMPGDAEGTHQAVDRPASEPDTHIRHAVRPVEPQPGELPMQERDVPSPLVCQSDDVRSIR